MPMIYDQDAEQTPAPGSLPAAGSPAAPPRPDLDDTTVSEVPVADVPTPPFGQPAVTPPPPAGNPSLAGAPAPWASPGVPTARSPQAPGPAAPTYASAPAYPPAWSHPPASPYPPASPFAPGPVAARPTYAPGSPYGSAPSYGPGPAVGSAPTYAPGSPYLAPPAAWDPRSPLPGQPPYGAPPSGPRPPIGGGVPQLPPAGSRRRGAGWTVAVVVIAFLLAFVGAGAVVATVGQSPAARTDSAARLSPSTTVPSSPSTTPSTAAPTAPADPGTGSGGGGSGSGSGAPRSWSEVAATINVGVVDIQSLLAGGVGAGTGMILTEDGEVLTNNHVVEDAEAIEVTLVTTGDTYEAEIVATDPTHDVALLKLQGASGLTPIPLGDSDEVQVGDEIAAIGNAGGKGGDPTVATGNVVGLHRQITASDQMGGDVQTLTDMIQVDANVVPGDSGGPLVSSDAKVVGINTAAAAGAGTGRGRYRTSANEGYAIPINRAVSIVEQLRSQAGQGGSSGQGSNGSGNGSGSNGSNRQGSGRAVLGVQVQAAGGTGAAVVGVQSGSGAAKAGLRSGDVIVEVDGTSVEAPSDLTAALSGKQVGDTVSVTWETARGQTRSAEVTLGAG